MGVTAVSVASGCGDCPCKFLKVGAYRRKKIKFPADLRLQDRAQLHVASLHMSWKF